MIDKKPVQTEEQQRRQQLQVDWLISALRRQAEPRPYRIDDESLGIPSRCPRCGERIAYR